MRRPLIPTGTLHLGLRWRDDRDRCDYTDRAVSYLAEQVRELGSSVILH